MSTLNVIRPNYVQNIIDKFCVTIGMLPTSYKTSISFEEQILAIGLYLENTIFPAINNNAEALAELQNLFIDLKNYVENYFDNLDVQTEINNKLDEMAEGGELQELITAYLQMKSILAFDTVADMKSSNNLIENSFVETYGFYEINDGGQAKYKIRSLNENETLDEITVISLENGLIAELLINDTMSIKQFGAKGNGLNDDTLSIQKALDNCRKIIIPSTSEFYKVTDNLLIYNNQIITGFGENSKILMPNNLIKSIFEIQNVKSIIIDNIKLCNESCQEGSTPDLTKNKIINIEGSQNISIKNCYFENAYSKGIYMFNSKNIEYINNHFKNATFDMLMLLPQVENVLVDNCIFDTIISTYVNTYLFATGRTDANMYDFSCKNITVKNSKFLNNPNWEGIDTHGCVGFYCENNYIENCKTGIMATLGNTAPNTLEEIKHGNIYIKNNIIKASQNANYGIFAGNSKTDTKLCENLFIENNYIEGFGNGNTIGAITIIGSKYLFILNNNILNSNGSGIALTNIINSNINNNNIIDTNSIYGIFFVAGCWFINVKDNIIKNVNINILQYGIRSSLKTIANFVNNEIVATNRYSTLGTIMTGVISDSTTQIGKIGNFVKDEYGFIKYYCTDEVVRPAKTETESNVSLTAEANSKLCQATNALYYLTEGEEIIIPGAGLGGTDLTTVITEFVNSNTFYVKDEIITNVENVNPRTNASTWLSAQ